MIRSVVLLGLSMLPAMAASAQTLTATRPGLMCVSPEALAELTLPDGSSRAASPNARMGDQLTKQRGGCIDIPPGARVTVLTAHRNTSIATYDDNSGRGPQTYVVPNADFAVTSGATTALPPGCVKSGDRVTVTGTIHMRTVPPDPDINRLRPWTYPVMTFDRAVCVRDPDFGDVPNGTRTSVIFSTARPPRLTEGQHLSLTGQLSPPDNGNQPPEPLMLFISDQ